MRPNASPIYAHTWFPGVPDVRRLLQPTGSSAVTSRVRRALAVTRRRVTILVVGKVAGVSMFGIVAWVAFVRASRSGSIDCD